MGRKPLIRIKCKSSRIKMNAFVRLDVQICGSPLSVICCYLHAIQTETRTNSRENMMNSHRKNVEELEMRIAAIGKWGRTNEDAAALIAYIDYYYHCMLTRNWSSAVILLVGNRKLWIFTSFSSFVSVFSAARLENGGNGIHYTSQRTTVCRSWSPHCIQKWTKYANRMRTHVLHVWIAFE